MHGCKLLAGLIFILWSSVLPGSAMPAGEMDGLIINLPSRTIGYYVDEQLVKEYPVAIGSPDTPTPLGEYSIVNKEIDPYWYPPENPGFYIVSGPSNPLGYRWMGFGGNYGIHGTNAPWSIGSVVSNGCVRMYEEDVEELFPLIDYGTPVRITYDRARLLVENDGWTYLALYPDVYGRQRVTVAYLKGLLQKAGFGGWIAEKTLRKILEGGTGTTRLGQFYHLTVNNQAIPEKAVGIGGTLYIPISAVAGALHNRLLWDDRQQTVTLNGHTANGIMKGNTVYVTLEEIRNLLGGYQEFDKEGYTLSLSFPCLVFEDQVVSELRKTPEGMAVPVMALASALGLRVAWNDDAKVLKLGCKKIPVEMLDGEPYIQITKLTEYFDAAADWNETEQTAQLRFPVHPLDYSMYLEFMADFSD